MRVICLSSVLRCSNLGAVELGWECLNQQGFPDPHLLCLAGTMCEVCGLLLLVVVGFLSRSRSHSPSFLLFQAWLNDDCWKGGFFGGGGLDAHSLSLPLQLPVGLKSSMVLTGKEKEKEKKSGGWELSWPERSSIGRMSGC